MNILTRARRSAGATLNELSQALGVRIATLMAWEADRRIPSPQNRKRVARLLGVEWAPRETPQKRRERELADKLIASHVGYVQRGPIHCEPHADERIHVWAIAGWCLFMVAFLAVVILVLAQGGTL